MSRNLKAGDSLLTQELSDMLDDFACYEARRDFCYKVLGQDCFRQLMRLVNVDWLAPDARAYRIFGELFDVLSYASKLYGSGGALYWWQHREPSPAAVAFALGGHEVLLKELTKQKAIFTRLRMALSKPKGLQDRGIDRSTGEGSWYAHERLRRQL